MKYKGIIRKIDELGRIVIPKEIRNVLNIKSNDDVEFFIEDDHITLKKSVDLGYEYYINDLLLKTSSLVDGQVLIADKEKIVNNGEYYGLKIPLVCNTLLNERREYLSPSTEIYILNGKEISGYMYFLPIIKDSIAEGIIIYVKNKLIVDLDIQYCNVIKNLIEKR